MDILKYLPETLQNDDLFIEVADILQSFKDGNYVVDSTVEDQISYPGIDIQALKDKYNDISSLDKESLEVIAKEFGYDYILNVLTLISDDFGTFLGTIAVVHYLKGTRKGIEFVLDVLGFTYLIIEWWEFTQNALLLRYFGVTNVSIYKTDNGDLITYGELPHTYFLRVYVDATKSIPSGESVELITNDIYDALVIFLRHYVYPLLLKLEVIALFIEDDWDATGVTEDDGEAVLNGISYTDERVKVPDLWDQAKWDVNWWDTDWKSMWLYVQEELIDELVPVP
jgi:hypothetical protein